ncbi:MAG: hypothetical protein LBU22_13020 [Dysgonamonadaceae bacterium]|jgi:hypothetical protein|nr:hypothetical protein [Dysgonamonadaceae bacterium]
MKRLDKIGFTCMVGLLAMAACSEAGDSFGDSGSPGQGGSMARFTIAGDYLYTVDNNSLRLFDLSNPPQPEYMERKDQSLSFGIETLFGMDTLLFIGSQDGMYIYDITRPEFPQQMSFVSHIRSCDPVVASGHYAYVTLNSENTWCGNVSNVLNIYDISNIKKPSLIAAETLNFPKGLGVDGNKLFVCDAVQGIKIYDVSEPSVPIWKDDLSHIPEAKSIKPYDVIPMNGLLFTSSDKGFYQFDYTGDQIKFVSKINITEK